MSLKPVVRAHHLAAARFAHHDHLQLLLRRFLGSGRVAHGGNGAGTGIGYADMLYHMPAILYEINAGLTVCQEFVVKRNMEAELVVPASQI